MVSCQTGDELGKFLSCEYCVINFIKKDFEIKYISGEWVDWLYSSGSMFYLEYGRLSGDVDYAWRESKSHLFL